MNQTLTYLFDPLCGWCYGAGASLSRVIAATGVKVEILPSGLFSGSGARPMDDSFADYAWANDQRIARLTGQPFSEAYRHQVLADRDQVFDSGPATVALTAVYLTAPERELEALKLIQHARYVDGQNITQPSLLAGLLQTAGLEAAAQRLAEPDAALLQANQERVQKARSLMQRFGVQGVPAFVLQDRDQQRLLHASAIFSNPQALIQDIRNATLNP